MKMIPLTQGKFAIVDDDDYEWLVQWNWFAHKGNNTFYAERKEGRFPFQKNIKMHRQIINTPDGVDVDHVDGDGLNNTRSNLRNCTNTQNQWNGRKRSDNASDYKGVAWEKAKRRWRALIRVNGKRFHIGYFKTPEEAARAYDAAARKHFGDFARLNFPDEGDRALR